MVLAKKTPAGTTAKEDRAGTLGSRKGRLFPEMGPYKRNTAGRAFPAKSQFSMRSIDLAVAGTKRAIFIYVKVHEHLSKFKVLKCGNSAAVSGILNVACREEMRVFYDRKFLKASGNPHKISVAVRLTRPTFFAARSPAKP